jgi:tRNA pseudouridine55 synthase
MGRKRRGLSLNGWLIIDKPAGLSSAAVVTRVRRATNAAKVGHGGTLDPLATGLLPLAFGEATKTVSYLMDGPKTYEFRIRWGEERSTDDSEGEVTATSDVRPSEAEITAVLERFTGDIEQVPPSFSAIKVNGERAYALARRTEDVALEARRVHIASFVLLGRPDADHADFRVVSGKGAYMRALARDVARALGTAGHIAALRRTRIGPFGEEDAISLDKLEELLHSSPAADILRPVETALDDIPALALTETEARRLQHGQPIPALQVARRTPFSGIEQGAVVCAVAGGKLVALARLEGGEIRPVRVMNL